MEPESDFCAILDAPSERETANIAQTFAAQVPDGTVVVLSGPLGAGKTRFVKGVATALGIDQNDVVSPTFVLCKHYRGRRAICHMDVYRLGDVDEYESLGPEDLYALDGVTFIEWGERVAEALPVERIEVRFEVLGKDQRRLHFVARGTRLGQALSRLKEVNER